jgi:hypothetical protein
VRILEREEVDAPEREWSAVAPAGGEVSPLTLAIVSGHRTTLKRVMQEGFKLPQRSSVGRKARRGDVTAEAVAPDATNGIEMSSATSVTRRTAPAMRRGTRSL